MDALMSLRPEDSEERRGGSVSCELDANPGKTKYSCVLGKSRSAPARQPATALWMQDLPVHFTVIAAP